MYLFGFGSLINLNSAQKSFKRELSYKDLIPVRVEGFKKVWNSIESICFEQEKIDGVFLNLQKDENCFTNGVVIKLSKQEFKLVKQREKNYCQIIIKKEQIKGATIEEDVVAFMTTNSEKIAKKGAKNTYIASKYIDILTDALKNYDENFVKEYEEQTLKEFGFPLKQGEYKFCDPVQNKLAKQGFEKTDDK